MFYKIFIIGVCVSGIMEWLKNFLPEKVKANNVILASISGVLAALAGAGYGWYSGLDLSKILIVAGLEIALVQTSYNLLFQTFKAIVTKLKEKVAEPVDTDAIATKVVDDIVDKATEGATSILEDVAKKE